MNFLTKEGVRVNVNKSELSNITHYSSQFVLRNVLYYSIRGRPTSHETWVFGMVDTSHQPALGYMEVVPQRDAATLLPISQAHVANGTIIHSDQWAAYRQVASLPSVSTHATVYHSVTFVDPVSGTHTQNIESYWGKAKRKLKNMKGCRVPTA